MLGGVPPAVFWVRVFLQTEWLGKDSEVGHRTELGEAAYVRFPHKPDHARYFSMCVFNLSRRLSLVLLFSDEMRPELASPQHMSGKQKVGRSRQEVMEIGGKP